MKHKTHFSHTRAKCLRHPKGCNLSHMENDARFKRTHFLALNSRIGSGLLKIFLLHLFLCIHLTDLMLS